MFVRRSLFLAKVFLMRILSMRDERLFYDLA